MHETLLFFPETLSFWESKEDSGRDSPTCDRSSDLEQEKSPLDSSIEKGCLNSTIPRWCPSTAIPADVKSAIADISSIPKTALSFPQPHCNPHVTSPAPSNSAKPDRLNSRRRMHKYSSPDSAF